jgi:DNA-binding MarR family transcriptional regulator
MDLEMVQFFARTMMTIHDIAILMEGHFARLGLSKARFMVMIQLHGHEDPAGICISDLISQYKVSSATMTGVIDTLEREGLIERIKSPQDRRRVNVRITDQGRAFMDDFLPKHHANMELFTASLGEHERRDLVALLGKLQRGIAGAVEEEHGAVDAEAQR